MMNRMNKLFSGCNAASSALVQNHLGAAMYLVVSVLVCLLNVRVWLCLL